MYMMKDDVSVGLIWLFEVHFDDNFAGVIEICNMFHVPMSDIKACREKARKYD